VIIEGNQLRVAMCACYAWHRIANSYSQIDLIFVPMLRDKKLLIQYDLFQAWIKALMDWRFEDEEAIVWDQVAAVQVH
jgi:hypothetical protein